MIEPSKQLIDTCKSIREPKSKCIHGALAEPGAPKYVIGPTGSPTGKTKRTNSGSFNDNMVQTFTISELLKMYKVTKVDFWSLDIEDHANYNETVDKEIKTLHEKYNDQIPLFIANG